MFSCFSTLVSLVEKTILSPLNCLCSFIKDQLTAYLSLFCSTDIYLFFHQYHTILISIALCQVLKSRSVSLRTLFFLFQYCVDYSGCCAIPQKSLEWVCQDTENNLMGFWLGLHRIYRLSWGKTDILTTLSLFIHEHGVSRQILTLVHQSFTVFLIKTLHVFC